MADSFSFSLFSDLIRGFLLGRLNVRLAPRVSGAERSQQFDAYILEELAPAMSIGIARIETLGPGTNPIVRKISDTLGGAHVARCFPRRIAGKEKSREHAVVSRLLAQTGVAVPRLEYCDTSYRTLGRYGFEVAAEEWVAGRHPSPEDLRSGDSRILLLRALANLLANLHARTAQRPGTPWRRRHEARDFIRRAFVEREQEALALVEESDLASRETQALRAVRDHLNRYRAGIEMGPPYSLVHGDLQAMNLVVRAEPGLRGSAPPGEPDPDTPAADIRAGSARAPSPDIVLIDFGTVHYGLWPWDFVGFHNGCAGRDVALTRAFVQSYFGFRPEADGESLDRAWAYLHPFYHVEKCAAALRKLRRARELRRTDRSPETLERRSDNQRQRAADQWRWAVEAVANPSSPLP